MKIVLIGYRGTGKSEVGKILAAKQKTVCISMDARIVEKVGMSIPEFVKANGWPKFRDTETIIAKELAVQDNIVVDCGGGVIERWENIEALEANSVIIWLKASVETIVKRIQGGTDRPSLTTGKSFTDEVAEVLERRTPLYQKAAHLEIDTDHLAPEAIADQVLGFIQRRS